MGIGKARNTKCIHLSENMLCKLFNKQERPKVCIECRPDPLFCGKSFEDAIKIFNSLE